MNEITPVSGAEHTLRGVGARSIQRTGFLRDSGQSAKHRMKRHIARRISTDKLQIGWDVQNIV